MKKIIFVCTGNTCRSPMAMAVFNKMAKEQGLNWVADSAGLAACFDKINPNSVEALAKIGINFSDYTSKRLNFQMINEASIIAVMTNEHCKALLTAGVDDEKIIVLGGGIADPYGGDINTYLDCLNQIESAINDLLKGSIFNISRAYDLKQAANDIAFIEKQCFKTPWSAEQVLSCDDLTVFFVAKQDGKTVGYAGMYTVLDEGYVTNVGVLPEYRKKGIGRALVNELIEYSSEKKLSFLSLEVRVSNTAAINLYSSLNFKEVGRRKNFYSNPKEDAFIMTRYF